MDKCKFLRQKKQVQINGEWVDTRSYRYIPYCDGGTPCVIIKGVPENTKIQYWTYNTEKEISHWDVNLDENGNGYFELKDDEILYRVYLPTDKGQPKYPLSEVDIKGCNVATANPLEGYGKIVFSCSTIISDEPNYDAYYGAYSYIYNGVDTSKSTNMAWMFYNCSGLTSLDLSGWDTSKVTDMNDMFNRCASLTSLDLSGWNTSKVTEMRYMFADCSSLTSVNLSSFDTSNVTDMYHMFEGCSGLTSLDVTHFDTSNVTDMSRMFYGCSGLTSLDLSGWNTSNVTEMTAMFNRCTSLESLDLSGWDISNVSDMRYMFIRCSKLKTIRMVGCNLDTIDVIKSKLKEAGIQDQVTIIT